MKFRIPLFLFLTSLVVGLFFLMVGMVWPGFFVFYLKLMAKQIDASSEEAQQLVEAWAYGFQWLGTLILFSGGLLYLRHKKLSNRAFAGIFVALMFISIVVAAVAATNI